MRLALLFLGLMLTACASKPPAPVEDRSGSARSAAPAPGHYRVHQGDTLYAIAFSHGLDYRDLARWNGLRVPYVIYPGQDLRLSAGPAATSASKPRKSAPAPGPARKPPVNATAKPSADVPARPSASASSAGAETRKSTTGVASSSGPMQWRWPADGRIVRGFLASDPSRNGLDIAGREGDAVKASGAGTVVYSGNGLLGYGELIIVKHSDQWLSAYAHNKQRLVDEGERVAAGQKIAELGRNDRNEQILHFEIRSNGKPVNPLDHLPQR